MELKDNLQKIIDSLNSKDIIIFCNDKFKKDIETCVKKFDVSYKIKIIENKMVSTDMIYVIRNSIDDPLYYETKKLFSLEVESQYNNIKKEVN